MVDGAVDIRDARDGLQVSFEVKEALPQVFRSTLECLRGEVKLRLARVLTMRALWK